MAEETKKRQKALEIHSVREKEELGARRGREISTGSRKEEEELKRWRNDRQSKQTMKARVASLKVEHSGGTSCNESFAT